MVDGIVRSVQTFAKVDSIVIPDPTGTQELLKVELCTNLVEIPLKISKKFSQPFQKI